MTFKIFLYLIISINFFAQNVYSQINKNSNFILIESGKFKAGNNKNTDELNSKKFKIKSFYINKFETTNLEYSKFLNSIKAPKEKVAEYINLKGVWRDIECGIYSENDSFFVKPNYENKPVIFVSWFGAEAFCKFYGFRLPSEFEWEFAASAKNINKKDISDTSKIYLDKKAWFSENSNNKIHNYGEKEADLNGLFDIRGNVSEWCNDWYSHDIYKNSKKENPEGNEKGKFKVHRGGSWINSADILSVTNRRASNPHTQNATIGFRTATDISE